MKKTIKIFSLPSHQSKDRTSGVDFARIIQPMKILNGYEDKDVKFEVEIFDINKEMNWQEVAKNFDIIYFNYILNPWGYAAMGAMARSHGVKLVLDLDDSLWHLNSDNPAYSVWKKGSDGINNFTCIANDVDELTVTNSYLKNVVITQTRQKSENIHAIDNYIDLENSYNHRSPFKDTNNITLLHHGSTTHFIDLETEEFAKGIDKIMHEYPNVTLKTIGAWKPKFRQRWGERYITDYGHPDIYEWIHNKYPSFMDEADIMVTPLHKDVYTSCKSGIKYLENSAAGKPGVYQDMRQYQAYIKNGQNGYLASTEQEWYKAIKRLIDDKEHRRLVGQNAFKTIENHTIQGNIGRYVDLFKKVLK